MTDKPFKEPKVGGKLDAAVPWMMAVGTLLAVAGFVLTFMEIALVFVLCVMASGELWERFEWGVWWTWEPRLTTYFILMLMVFAFFILRNAVEDPERRATYSAVLGILICVDVPICFMITRIIPSGVHPVIFRTDSGLSPDMLLPFLLSLFGMMLIAFGLYRLRLRTQIMQDKVARLSDALED